MSQKKQPRYSSDKPISKLPEDKLGRSSFATRLANDIAAWGGDSSLVIGLYGDWGVGKTSLKNLVLASLKKRRSKIPILEFNPWQLSGSGGTTEFFLNELKIKLASKAVSSEQETAEVRKRLTRYSKRLSFGSVVGRMFSPLFIALGQPEAAVASAAAAEALSHASDVTKAGADTLDERENADDSSLFELKKSLDASLRNMKRPLLVVIDDIDRLTTREILDIFQLVKVNADFPKVIYLMLFERNIVATALDSVSDGRGVEFLEKIIQVGYHIPKASRASIQKVLFEGLDEILARPGVLRRWNTDRWSRIYLDALQGFFRNLRHIYRFLSSFDFHVRQFQHRDHFEVNPIDLIALETLRVFEPNVFEKLAALKTILTRDTGKSLFGEIKQDDIETSINELIKLSSQNHVNSLRRIILSIFPSTSSTYSGNDGVSSEDSQKWLREARACHPNMFDRYFTLAVGEGEFAQTELDQLIDESGDHAKFSKRITALHARGLLNLAFEHLDACKEDIPLENMEPLTRALSDLSDLFPPRSTSMFETEAKMMAARLIHCGLRREKNEQERLRILVSAFKKSTGSLLPTFVTLLQTRRQKNVEQGQEYLISESDCGTLRDICAQKISLAAASDQIITHPQANLLLQCWKDWDTSKAKSWIKQKSQSSKGALWLLSVLLLEIHSHGSKVTIRYFIKLSNIEQFVEVDALKCQLEHVDLEKLTERERIAVNAFDAALRRRSEGKPESDGFDQDWDF
ncbi:KAP family P-loop NTPase fold protein [Prosthecobacter fluviatilis]|uniref:P-loop NTPase fold protein n=1 Tax=Prosthecobacter fluviatilis TaxID=445931 RepID=A0ABW0KW05_9BACT